MRLRDNGRRLYLSYRRYLPCIGVLAGILILGVINNGLVMLKVDDNMTNIVKGVIIVGSVVLDMRKNAKRA